VGEQSREQVYEVAFEMTYTSGSLKLIVPENQLVYERILDDPFFNLIRA
jgi:hypothetical protein